MTKLLKRVGGAFGIGLGWAVAWAPVAVLLGIGVIDPDNSMDEMWVAIGAYPGFISGVIFSTLLGIAERGRGLDELPLPRAGFLGAAAGLPVGGFVFALGGSGSALPLWQFAGAFLGIVVLLSALSAVGSALVVRSLRRRRLHRA